MHRKCSKVSGDRITRRHAKTIPRNSMKNKALSKSRERELQSEPNMLSLEIDVRQKK